MTKTRKIAMSPNNHQKEKVLDYISCKKINLRTESAMPYGGCEHKEDKMPHFNPPPISFTKKRHYIKYLYSTAGYDILGLTDIIFIKY